MSDFDAELLNVTIPNFHNLLTRIAQFQYAWDEGYVERWSRINNQISYVFAIADERCIIEKLRHKGKLPLRVTNNDPQFNNILFDDSIKARYVIDLDTDMPGIVHDDFGDGIRIAASTASKDESDLNEVDFDIDLLEAFSAGYLEACDSVLSEGEKGLLVSSAALFSYTMGVRFLTDYLQGGKYYKVQYPDHNLDRARNQLHLASQAERKISILREIIEKYR